MSNYNKVNYLQTIIIAQNAQINIWYLQHIYIIYNILEQKNALQMTIIIVESVLFSHLILWEADEDHTVTDSPFSLVVHHNFPVSISPLKTSVVHNEEQHSLNCKYLLDCAFQSDVDLPACTETIPQKVIML